ncbi:MAG: PEP-CTERM-box response regulator transcription factor [Steroidobacteraceae bacterium]
MTDESRFKRLLIVEDDAGLRSQLRWCFDGYEVAFAEDRNEAIAAVRRFEPSVVLQDLGLPPDPAGTTEGFATLATILELAPHTKLIVVTGNNERESAVKAVAMGAYDFYQKPVDVDALRLLVGRAFHIARLEREVADLRERSATGVFDGFIAADNGMLNVCRMLEKVAPANVSVLILGESGTGKESLARAVHTLSPRADKHFQAINCAAIPEQLLESELFGYEKGAFTGAVKTTPGKVESAQGGTLFLDEIGDMPLALQAKLLRFLQNKVIERVGGRQEIPVDVRIVAATNQDLAQFIKEQRFRQDLYYRISEVTLAVPPLRERPADIFALSHAFLARFSRDNGRPKRGFTNEALTALNAYSWPGNVRELESKIKVACLLGDDPLVSAQDLTLATADGGPQLLNLKEARSRAEHETLARAMSIANGNITKAAELLGVARPTLYDLLSRHGFPGHDRAEAAEQPASEAS